MKRQIAELEQADRNNTFLSQFLALVVTVLPTAMRSLLGCFLVLTSVSAHAASLVIGDAPAQTAVDLTATGGTDWVHWGLTTASSVDRKAGVTPQIGSLTNVGGVIKRYNAPAGVRVDYNWSDGTPTVSTTTTTGLYLAGVGNRFELSVPADTTAKTLTLYAGGWKARGQLDISLSDGSATPVSVVIDNPTGTIDREVTISFAAASVGQSLLISYTLLDDYEVGGNITVAGAALVVAVSSGSLITGDAPAPAAVDLTATGSADWVHWGLTTASSVDRKAGVTPQIGSLTNVGGVIKRYNASAGLRVDYNWSDGTPTVNTTTTTGLYLAGVGNRFELSVPADTTAKTLTLYAGGWRARGQLDISLSDGSATPVSVVIDNPTGTIDREVTISFAAVSVGQSLLISYTLLDDYGVGGNITMAGAALAVAGGNLAPVATDDTASTSINEVVIINVLSNDSDVDGTIDQTTVVVTLPASNGAAVANFDGIITYTPSAGYTGTDSFSYTVQDNLGKTSNVATVTVNVQAALPKLKVSANGHHIVQDDGSDTPFFWVGDTAWAIHNKYADENANNIHDIDEYLAHAQTANFNVIQLMAITPWALDDQGLNRNGDAPFIGVDPTKFNNAFWDNIASVIDKAEAKGIYTMLVVGGPMRSNQNIHIDTEAVAYEYGRQLGIKFGSKNSLIWSLGQDVKADDEKVTTGLAGWRALAEGIADGVNGENNNNGSANYDTTFMTYHPGGWPCGLSTSQWFHNDAWLDIHAHQSGGNLQGIDSMARNDYALVWPKPIVNIEGTYEGAIRAAALECGGGSGSSADAHKIRRQAYHTITGGAFGHTYGNNYIWQGGEWPYSTYCCNEPGSNPPTGYNAPGRQQMRHLRDFFENRKWWKYIPDQNIITSGAESGTVDGGDNRKTSMKSSDGDEIIVYFPVNNQATIDLSFITSTSTAVAQWFDPRNGSYSTAGLASLYTTNSLTSFSPPSGFEDAVLVIQAPTAEYEAEASSATIGGGAYVRSRSVASGGQVVDYIGNGTSNYLQFNQVYVENAGDVIVTFSYISGEDRSAMISVNGGAYQRFTFANSGGWNNLGTRDITLNLNAGENTIRITNDTWYTPMIDKITFQ